MPDWQAAPEAAQRAAVVAEARSWIGTPYHHQADIKGAGVDCAMILVRVWVDLGLVPAFDPRPYPIDWHLHQAEERYLAQLQARAVFVDAPLPGDIVVWRYGRTFSHAGIVTQWPRVVHAYHPAGIVEEADVSRPGALSSKRRAKRFLSYWGHSQ